MTDAERRIFEKLTAPIPAELIKTRVGQGGRELRYIEPKTVMERLDDAVGPANWNLETTMGPEWVRCRITIQLPDGRQVVRDGIGGYPDMPLPEDRVKGGASDGLKRAGVLLGIGRHLYEDAPPTAGSPARPPQPQRGTWGSGRPRPPAPARQSGGNGGPKSYGPPRTGKALYAWSREHGCVDQANEAGAALGARGRMVDWPAEIVRDVYNELTGEVVENREPGGDDEPNF